MALDPTQIREQVSKGGAELADSLQHLAEKANSKGKKVQRKAGRIVGKASDFAGDKAAPAARSTLGSVRQFSPYLAALLVVIGIIGFRTLKRG